MRTAFWRMDPQGGLENRCVLYVTQIRDVFSRAVACESNFCKQSLGGYKEITLSICLSVHLYDCAILSSPYLSYRKKNYGTRGESQFIKLNQPCQTHIYKCRTSHAIKLTLFQPLPAFLPLWFKFADTTLFILGNDMRLYKCKITASKEETLFKLSIKVFLRLQVKDKNAAYKPNISGV